MSTLDVLTGVPNLPFGADSAHVPAGLSADARFAAVETTDDSQLGQTEFLELMLTQIQHQDPFEPTGNGEFIAQMAQFSTVSGIGDMQKSLDRMSTSFGAQQTLEASSLVGREVLVAGDALALDGAKPAQGRFAIESAASTVTLYVQDASGALVAKRNLGAAAAGRHDFEWNGQDDAGQTLQPGTYRVTVMAGDGDGTGDRVAETLMSRHVAAVEFGAGGAVLMHTEEGETLGLDALREIRQGLTSPLVDTEDRIPTDPGELS